MSSSIFSTRERRILCVYFGMSEPDKAVFDSATTDYGIDAGRCGGVLTPVSVATARTVTPGRHSGRDPSSERNVLMLPRQALRVFWGDQIVGTDAYSLVWVPEFRRFVVTAAGSPRNYGYPLFAIGHFAPTSKLRDALGEVLRRWWGSQREAGRGGWLGCESSALVPESYAIGWREMAWGQINREAALKAG